MAAASNHERWMALALRLARNGYYSTPPNPRVGCAIVKSGELLGSGWHEYTGGPHAEVNAIESAAIPAGADFYVTLEPCSHHGRTPPCVDALLAARAARVIAAMPDPNPEVGGRGFDALRAGGVEVIVGVMQAQARALNPGFIKRMEQGLPLVGIKLAASLDGRSALKNGASQWITSPAARRDVQFLRAAASVILTTAATVQADDACLDLRLDAADLGQRRAPRQPLRVVLDSGLRLGGDERLFSTGGDILVFTLSRDAGKRERLQGRGAEVIAMDGDENGRIPLRAMLETLAARGINEVHTECGPGLAGALVSQRLADRVVLYLAPQLLGDQARGLFDLGELTSLEQRVACQIIDLRQLGPDLRLTLQLNQE